MIYFCEFTVSLIHFGCKRNQANLDLFIEKTGNCYGVRVVRLRDNIKTVTARLGRYGTSWSVHAQCVQINCTSNELVFYAIN